MALRRRDVLGFAGAATLLALARTAPAADLPARWQPGDAPPPVEGIRLGDTLAQVVAVLGAPDPSPLPDDPDADLHTLRYRGGALMLLVSKAEGVLRIRLGRANGGSLAGFGVGDRLGRLLADWGEPTTSTTKLGRYQMGDWTITVKADLATQTILTLMLARTPGQPLAAPAMPAPAATP